MEDAAFVILGPGLLFLATMAGGWVVIVVGAGAEGAPGCAVLAWLLGHLHPGFLVEYPGPGLAAYAGLACGISLGLRTAESAAPSRVGKSVLPDAGHCHTPIAYFRRPISGGQTIRASCLSRWRRPRAPVDSRTRRVALRSGTGDVGIRGV
jgi:hypothetical protein